MNPNKILRIKTLCALLDIKPGTLRDWRCKSSPRFDATFPSAVRLGKRAVGFKEIDVMAWITSKQEA